MRAGRVDQICARAFVALVLAGASVGAVYGAAWGWQAAPSGLAGLLLAALLGLAGTVPGGASGRLPPSP